MLSCLVQNKYDDDDSAKEYGGSGEILQREGRSKTTVILSQVRSNLVNARLFSDRICQQRTRTGDHGVGTHPNSAVQ